MNKPITDPMMEKYPRLDGRLHKAPFDPSVPYFLDEAGSVHEVTGSPKVDKEPIGVARKWWKFRA